MCSCYILEVAFKEVMAHLNDICSTLSPNSFNQPLNKQLCLVE